jgi:hypothetical protein
VVEDIGSLYEQEMGVKLEVDSKARTLEPILSCWVFTRTRSQLTS